MVKLITCKYKGGRKEYLPHGEKGAGGGEAEQQGPYCFDTFDIEASGSNIGGHQHIDLLVLELPAKNGAPEKACPAPTRPSPATRSLSAYRRASNRWAWERLPCSSPTRRPIRPRRICRRWACFLVWVKSITWSGNVRVSRAGEQRETHHCQLPLLNPPPEASTTTSPTCHDGLPVPLTAGTDADELLAQKGGHLRVAVHKDPDRVFQRHRSQILDLTKGKEGSSAMTPSQE